MMHVVDTVLDSFSNLFQSHRYSPLERIYSVFLFTAGISLREMKRKAERFYNFITAIAILHNVIRAEERG